MWPVLITFLVTSSACFGILTLFMRSGRNRESDAMTRKDARPLVFGALTQPLAGMLPMRQETGQHLAKFLRQAGFYHSQALVEFLALRNSLIVGSLLLTATAIVVLSQPGEPAMIHLTLGGLLAMIMLFAMPRLVLESMAKNRTRRIEESLPDALDMITMCTSAGLPLQQAIFRVSEEIRSSHPDLSFELRIVGRHTEAGSLNSAIHQFAKRVDAPEAHSVAAMVWQAEQQGASVAGAFLAFSDQVRLNRRQRAEEAGNKAAFKMLFPLVFCLAPAVYLVLLGPAVMELRDFFVREKSPGGALSASSETMQSVLADPTMDSMGDFPTGTAGNPGGP